MGGAKIAMVRQAWSDIAVRFTATANKRMTLQCAEEMHRHLDLGKAFDVLEVGAGAGLGSLDIAQRMAAGATTDTKKKKHQLMVTDLSPTMVELARETLRNAPSSELIETQVKEANGQDLQDVATDSVDRYISSMCLQITPDPDAMLRETKRILKPDGIAGFTIWGRPEFSGFFTIESLVSREVGLSDEEEHPNFALGKDLNALRQKFAAAGFSQVRIWPFLCVLELWSGEEFAKFNEEMFFYRDEALRARRFKVAERLADEWLATRDVPIGLESYIITAKV